MIKYLLAFFLIVFSNIAFSQNILVRQFPPSGTGLKVNELWSLSVTSLETEAINVSFRVTVTEQTKGVVLNANSATIRLSPGSRNIQGRFVEPINYDITDNGVLNSIRRTGSFPDGNYSICVDMINSNTQDIISNSCTDHEVATALAPILFSPYDASDVYDNIIVWSWFMQPEISTGEKVVCDLIVVEVMEGQTLEEALKLNPPVIIRPNLTTAQWQTNFATRHLIAGRTYAWKVIAKAGDKILNESEIWKFEFNEPVEEGFMTEFSEIGESENQVSESEVKEKKFSIGGKSRFTFENSTRQAILSGTPQTFGRIEAEPNVNLFGVPLGLNFILSSEENSSNYNMSRAVFGIAETKQDVNFAIGQRIEDKISELEKVIDSENASDLKELSFADSLAVVNRIEELRRIQSEGVEDNLETLKMFDLVTPEQELMADVPAFGIGKVNPGFSHLFMSNVAVNGGLLEYNPGDFYIGGVIGKLQSEFNIAMLQGNEFVNTELEQTPEFFKNIYVGRIGYGKKSGNHAIISVLYAADDEQSRLISSLIDSTGNTLSPENNYNIGLSTRFADNDLGLTFDGELNASVFNSNINGGLVTNPEVPSFFKSVFGNEIKSGTLADFSYAARGSYQFQEDGRLQAGVRFVGPGYRSVGVAGLRNDLMQYDIRYIHYLFSRQIKLDAFLSNEEAGYILSELSNSNMNKLGARAEFRFRNLPVLQFNYIGNLQKIKTEFEEEANNNDIHQLTANLSHGYQSGQTRFISFLSFNYQKGTSKDSLADFETNIVMFNQRVSFWQMISLGLMGSYTSTVSPAEPDLKPVYTVDFSIVHTPTEWMTTSLGVNVNDSETGSMRSFYFSSRLRLFDNIETDLRLDSRTFSNEANPKAGFNETVARLIAIYHLN